MFLIKIAKKSGILSREDNTKKHKKIIKNKEEKKCQEEQ